MNFLAFFVFGILGAGMTLLLFSGNSGMVGPVTGEQFARTVQLGLIGIVIAAGLFASGQRFGVLARQAGIWLALLVVLVIGYEYRYELGASASRVTSGLVPGLPVSSQNASGDVSVTINKSGRHFQTLATVNGSNQGFLIDTGASTIVLTETNALKAGYDPASLDFTIPISTANGVAMAARISRLDIRIGSIERGNLIALVARADALQSNLLGMNFLDTLTSFEVSRDRMVLRD